MVALKEMATKFAAIPLNRAVKVAAIKDALGDTATAGVLGLADAEGSPLLGTTTNGGSTATASDTALFLVTVPADYVPGGKIGVRARCKVSAARNASATVDIFAKEHGDSLGSDVCATAAQSINSTTLEWKYFSITPTGFIPGLTTLSLTITLATDDTGAAANGAASCTQLALEYEGRY